MRTTFFILLSAIAFLQLPSCSFATAQTKTAAVDAHMVVNKGGTLKGTMVITNCDKTSLTQSKETLTNTLTKKVQADDTKNSNSKVSVTGIRELEPGTLAFDYECTESKNPEKAKETLNTCVKHDDVKKVIAKSSSNVATTQAKQQANVQQTKAQPATQAPKAATAAPKSSQSKPTKAVNLDCDKTHQIVAQDENSITGVFTVHSCKASRFTQKQSRCTSLGSKLSSLVTDRVAKTGDKKPCSVNIVKASGTSTSTEFRYTLPCEKSRQKAVIDSLKDACKDKNFADTITNIKQKEQGESSSSESDENNKSPSKPVKVVQTEQPKTTTTAKPTEKPTTAKPTEKPTTAKPTEKPTTVKTTPRKTTKAGATKKPPATTRKVEVKNCDDHDYNDKDQVLTGKIVVQDCPCEKRFANNASRLAAVSSTVCTQLRNYFQQLYGTKINYPCSLKVVAGNKTHTVFAYTVNVPQSEQSKAKAAAKKACQDDQVKKVIEQESLKRDGDDDSDSSSSEETTRAQAKPVTTQKATEKPTEKPTTAKPTEKPTEKPTTSKPTEKPTTVKTSESNFVSSL
ncbi:unnamed protein product [Adineta ricciae]|uniref:Uncharacterized protein n=1 Tax=Adineta ricciae TaxID=249248 RepID=A0A815K950_ADIRI|nr:unnamed protein product [Adineta ricciae]CAF1396417.1 unnamed protein product [Adineta ricciae]